MRVRIGGSCTPRRPSGSTGVRADGRARRLDLAEAFGLLQSGLTLEQFRARQARTRAKATVKEARSAVSADQVDGWLSAAATEKAPLAFVLADRTLLDVLLQTHPVAFVLERSGRVEKLAVCALARRSTWDVLLPRLPRDSRLAQKPVPVAREPDRRPHSDPRPFLPAVGGRVRLVLRNGFAIEETLLSVGPYDLVLGWRGPRCWSRSTRSSPGSESRTRLPRAPEGPLSPREVQRASRTASRSCTRRSPSVCPGRRAPPTPPRTSPRPRPGASSPATTRRRTARAARHRRGARGGAPRAAPRRGRRGGAAPGTPARRCGG